ncbi:hypothetical protein HYE68_000009 [Fusarium pseudograminearum]|nr:hypothetical protein HYE68_000009 [Fusarium pseudograminearum]
MSSLEKLSVTQSLNVWPAKTQPQNDVMAWHIEEALRKKESYELMSQLIASRVFATTMAALEAVTLTVAHALFCVASSNSSVQIWRALEEEARHVLHGPINQDSIDKLHFADAAIKEGLRLQTALKALTVQVMHPTGITIKDIGVHQRQGARISVSAWGINRDEYIYPNAYTYDTFRFAPQRRNVCTSEGSDDEYLMTTPSEKYLSFGFGKHACPGRHLADQHIIHQLPANFVQKGVPSIPDSIGIALKALQDYPRLLPYLTNDPQFYIERVSAEGWSIHGSFLHAKKMDRASTAPLPRHFQFCKQLQLGFWPWASRALIPSLWGLPLVFWVLILKLLRFTLICEGDPTQAYRKIRPQHTPTTQNNRFMTLLAYTHFFEAAWPYLKKGNYERAATKNPS